MQRMGHRALMKIAGAFEFLFVCSLLHTKLADRQQSETRGFKTTRNLSVKDRFNLIEMRISVLDSRIVLMTACSRFCCQNQYR